DLYGDLVGGSDVADGVDGVEGDGGLAVVGDDDLCGVTVDGGVAGLGAGCGPDGLGDAGSAAVDGFERHGGGAAVPSAGGVGVGLQGCTDGGGGGVDGDDGGAHVVLVVGGEDEVDAFTAHGERSGVGGVRRAVEAVADGRAYRGAADGGGDGRGG